MCGIAGWILKDKPKHRFLLSLMHSIEQRGHQSFGYYNGETNQISRAVGSIIETVQTNNLMFSHGFFHTRHATKGKVTEENSHPFTIGDIIGAHNGVIYNHEQLNEDHKRTFAVDSQHIFAHILEGKNLRDLDGYGAIEYVRTGHYFVGACNGGELCVALLKEGIVWASTAEAIRAAVFQAGYTLIHFYQIEAGHVYEVRLSGLFETDETFKLDSRPILGNGFDRKHWWEYTIEREGKPQSHTHTTTPDTKLTPLGDLPYNLTTFDDTCDMCGEWTEVSVQPDSTLACENCLMELEDELSDTEDHDIPIAGDEDYGRYFN